MATTNFTTAHFTVYEIPTYARPRRLGDTPASNPPIGVHLIALPAAHILDDTTVAGVVRLGLPDGITIAPETTDGLAPSDAAQPIVGSERVLWNGEECVVDVTGGVAGRYTARRVWDGATLDLIRLAVLA
jgi:hypothetical protein